MILRANKFLIDRYLAYRKVYDHLDDKSVCLEQTWCRHILEWAGEHPFHDAPKIVPTFPEYVCSLRAEGKGTELSHEYRRKMIDSGRHLFRYLRIHVSGHKSISEAWLDTLKLGREAEDFGEIPSVSLEEISAIARAPVDTLNEKRTRAAACMLYGSGMRADALVSIPIEAVKVPDLEVHQLPKEFNVRTKFKKAAITFLLDIQDVLAVIKGWDHMVRAIMPPNCPWFAPINPLTGELDPEYIEAGEHRASGLRKDLKEWLNKVGLPYYSPHDFRRGHANYCLTNAKDYMDMLAAMSNLMHEGLAMTEYYARLKRADAKKRITRLGKAPRSITENSDLIHELETLLARLKGATS